MRSGSCLRTSSASFIFFTAVLKQVVMIVLQQLGVDARSGGDAQDAQMETLNVRRSGGDAQVEAHLSEYDFASMI